MKKAKRQRLMATKSRYCRSLKISYSRQITSSCLTTCWPGKSFPSGAGQGRQGRQRGSAADGSQRADPRRARLSGRCGLCADRRRRRQAAEADAEITIKRVPIQRRATRTMRITSSGSRPSARGPSEWFTGIVRIDPLFAANAPARAAGNAVTFDPGARTAWHTHPLRQTLIVTFGRGWVQREGGPVEEIRPRIRV